MTQLQSAFTMIDQDRDGVIGKSDLKETYASLGKLNVNDEELKGMLSEASGPVSFTTFLSLFGNKLNGTDPEETILNVLLKSWFINRCFMSLQVEQMFQCSPIDPAGNLDYKSLCYIITHGEEKEE
uniref:Myosin, light chain 7, regulatory n=1 Tax=Eptatretus burgeri TaxID=7764 RepID=A0A8C4QFK5_EPTBU